MPTIPTPTPAPTSHAPDLLPMLLHSLGHAFTALFTTNPVVGVLAVLGVLFAVGESVRQIRHSGRRDVVRSFNRADKAVILRRAGYRCESHGLFGRCRETDRLEADHVHPWSRGGQTAVSNGQALCRRHNRAKRATVPYAWQLRALERRRAGYFPAGVPGGIVRRRSAVLPDR